MQKCNSAFAFYKNAYISPQVHYQNPAVSLKQTHCNDQETYRSQVIDNYQVQDFISRSTKSRLFLRQESQSIYWHSTEELKYNTERADIHKIQ